MLFPPILSFLPKVRGRLAHPLGGGNFIAALSCSARSPARPSRAGRSWLACSPLTPWTFSGFRLAPHEGGRDVFTKLLLRSFPSKYYAAHGAIFNDDVRDVTFEADFAAEFDDLMPQIFDDLHEPQRADVRLADVEDFLGCARVHEVLENLFYMMPAVLDAGVQLAVGEGAGTALAELHVGFRIEVALAPEAPHVLRAVAHALAAFQNQRPEAHARQRQPREQATGTGADDDGPRFDICRRLNRVMIGLVRRFPDVLAVFEALKQRRFIPDRGVEGVDEHDFAGLARVVAAPAYTIA